MEEAIIFEKGYQTVHMINETIIDSKRMIEDAFKTHFEGLHRYAYTIIRDELMAEEMVQNVFYKLWKNKDQFDISGTIAGYLYRSVYNECLNHVKHEKVKAAYRVHMARTMENLNNAAEKLKLKELEEKLDEALRALPEQCRTIFQMSRFEQLKYLEIADRLGLSVKTVENQMGKALKILRTQLAEYLPILLILLFNF